MAQAWDPALLALCLSFPILDTELSGRQFCYMWGTHREYLFLGRVTRVFLSHRVVVALS